MTTLDCSNGVDIDSLFDAAAQGEVTPPAKPAAEAAPAPATSQTTTPTTTQTQNGEEVVISLKVNTDAAAYDVFQRIGTLTRRLHDALHELGYDKAIENAVDSLPDARARLSYIARLTGESADKVLNAVEQAQIAQDEMRDGANKLHQQWKAKTPESLSGEEAKRLIAETNDFLGNLSMSTDLTNSYLTQIMMAQDFHDLTGQVINKIGDLAQNLESQLLKLLLEATPPDMRKSNLKAEEGWLNGPVISAEGRTDVVTGQEQVDDLLESLGF